MEHPRRNFFVTIFKEHDDDEWLFSEGLLSDDMRYLVGQLEVCPTTGKEHYHFYVEFTKSKRMAGIKKIFKCNWMNVQPRKGTPQQCKDYCTKTDSRIEGPWEFGEMGMDGNAPKRNDLLTIKAHLDAGRSPLDIVNEDEKLFGSLFRYQKNWATYNTWKHTQRDHNEPMSVYVFWGEPGTGKTREAVQMCENEHVSYYFKDSTHKWWDGYDQQHTIIIDDFDPTSTALDRTYMKRIMDRYAFTGEVKGSMVKINSRRLIITTNVNPEYWYTQVHVQAIRRRCTQIREFI